MQRRTIGKNMGDKNPVLQGPLGNTFNVPDALRTGVVCDGTKSLEMTGTRPPSDACPAGTNVLKTVWKGGGGIKWSG